MSALAVAGRREREQRTHTTGPVADVEGSTPAASAAVLDEADAVSCWPAAILVVAPAACPVVVASPPTTDDVSTTPAVNVARGRLAERVGSCRPPMGRAMAGRPARSRGARGMRRVRGASRMASGPGATRACGERGVVVEERRKSVRPAPEGGGGVELPLRRRSEGDRRPDVSAEGARSAARAGLRETHLQAQRGSRQLLSVVSRLGRQARAGTRAALTREMLVDRRQAGQGASGGGRRSGPAWRRARARHKGAGRRGLRQRAAAGVRARARVSAWSRARRRRRSAGGQRRDERHDVRARSAGAAGPPSGTCRRKCSRRWFWHFSPRARAFVDRAPPPSRRPTIRQRDRCRGRTPPEGCRDEGRQRETLIVTTDWREGKAPKRIRARGARAQSLRARSAEARSREGGRRPLIKLARTASAGRDASAVDGERAHRRKRGRAAGEGCSC